MKNLLMYCRPGFEADCAAEINDRLAEFGVFGYPKFEGKSGFVLFVIQSDIAAEEVIPDLEFNSLSFVRQILAVNEPLSFESGNRVECLLEAARELPLAEGIWLETADTNDGKTLAGLIKKLEKPLLAGWKKSGLIRTKAKGVRHHVFLTNGNRAWLGVSYAACRSPFPMGIRRLKFPNSAPSRSTLKLEEAFHQFVPEKQWGRELREGMVAVDLGAAPGGWTWQFVQRGIKVIAIDNGPMQQALMDTGLVDHRRADGFKFMPPAKVDWLVCDMVERPIMVAELMARWLVEGWTQRALFNLKLPMKKHYQEVVLCLKTIEKALDKKGLSYRLQSKQLYHDREEITVCIQIK